MWHYQDSELERKKKRYKQQIYKQMLDEQVSHRSNAQSQQRQHINHTQFVNEWPDKPPYRASQLESKHSKGLDRTLSYEQPNFQKKELFEPDHSRSRTEARQDQKTLYYPRINLFRHVHNPIADAFQSRVTENHSQRQKKNLTELKIQRKKRLEDRRAIDLSNNQPQRVLLTQPTERKKKFTSRREATKEKKTAARIHHLKRASEPKAQSRQVDSQQERRTSYPRGLKKKLFETTKKSVENEENLLDELSVLLKQLSIKVQNLRERPSSLPEQKTESIEEKPLSPFGSPQPSLQVLDSNKNSVENQEMVIRILKGIQSSGARLASKLNVPSTKVTSQPIQATKSEIKAQEQKISSFMEQGSQTLGMIAAKLRNDLTLQEVQDFITSHQGQPELKSLLQTIHNFLPENQPQQEVEESTKEPQPQHLDPQQEEVTMQNFQFSSNPEKIEISSSKFTRVLNELRMARMRGEYMHEKLRSFQKGSKHLKIKSSS